MNLQQLESFVWVARLLSVTAAAERLGVPQPTVSMRLRELESEFGVALLRRDGRSIALTRKGEELAEIAEKVVALVGEIRQRLADPGSISGRLKIGVAELVATSWLPELVAQVNRRFPQVLLEVRVELMHSLLELLRNGTLDILLSPLPARSAPELASLYLGSLEMAFVTSPGLKVPRGTLSPDQLLSFPIITMGDKSIIHDMLEDWFGRVRGPNWIDLLNNFGVMASLAVSGLGIAMLPPACYAREIAQRRLRVLRTDPPVRPIDFFAIYPPVSAHPLAPLVAALAAEVSDFPLRKLPQARGSG